MKKQVVFLLLIFCILAGFARAATISGMVTNSTTGTPVAGQNVYVFDSLTSWIDTATTNSSGIYSVTLPASVVSGHPVTAYTTSCGTIVYRYNSYLGSNLTANFSVCVPLSGITLHGTVLLSGGTNNGMARLYLIRQDIDSVTRDTTLAVVDSFSTSATGGTFSKTYSSMPYGMLLLKAALLPSHPAYASYLPTYYDSALVWSNATQLSANNFNPSSPTRIYMRAGTNTGGPGFVSGSVVLGANKTSAVGDPLANRVLLLTTSAGAPVAYAYSDAAGRFSISKLNYGTYKIFGDAWGRSNPALTFTLTAAKPGITDIVFEENSSTFKGRLATLAIVEGSAISKVAVYPNPVTDHISFTGLNNISGAKSIVLRDVTGATLIRQSFANGQQVSVTTGNLPAGVYILQLQTEAGTANYQVVK